MYTIQILNNIAPRGLSLLEAAHYQVADKLAEPHALLLRSHNLHDQPIPESLLVVARAGVGINNIPVEQMSALGIPVLNTPGANANAVKELVLTGMLLASRHICPAWDYTRQLTGDDASLNQQAEQQKKRFSGSELAGKTLGIIGLGHIGIKLANVAVHLGMKVIGFDPAISVENAWQLSSTVKKASQLSEVYSQADFISLHVPLLESTRHLINTNSLVTMKKGVVLLNFARAPIVDQQALAQALQDKKVAYYVTDFPSQTLKSFEQVICLPHLGASTREAEENCAVMAVQQLKDYLQTGAIKNSVNFPAVSLPLNGGHRLAIVNRNVPNMVAQISSVLSQSQLNIVEMVNKSRGDMAYNLLDLSAPISDELTKTIKNIKGVIRVRKISHKY